MSVEDKFSVYDHRHRFLGFGLGLRTEHYESILKSSPAIDWFEILTENYLVSGGKPLHYLDRICERYPVVMHGVSLSIGSTDPLDLAYLDNVLALVRRVNPVWVSDHLCWTGVDEKNTHDLLPLPYTEEAIAHVVERISRVQDILGRQLLLENVSSYVTYHDSMMPEWEFIREVATRADCLLLLDINNIYVSAINHHFDPLHYLHGIPRERVQQYHVAGHTDCGDYLIDTHDAPVVDAVWELYAAALKHIGLVSTMIERDEHIPPLHELIIELNHARDIASSVCVLQEERLYA